MNEPIYKSCTAGISNEQFKATGLSGTTCFASYDTILNESIVSAILLKHTERIRGMVITEDGIKFYIDKK